MSERKLVVDQLKLSYVGIFDLNSLYRMIDAFFYDKGYDKQELKNFEQVLPSGKDIEIELLPYRKYTDYFKGLIKIRIKFTKIKDVFVEKENKKLKINNEKIHDYEF